MSNHMRNAGVVPTTSFEAARMSTEWLEGMSARCLRGARRMHCTVVVVRGVRR